MRYAAAYLLARLGGNNNPSQKDIENILGSVGIDAEAENTKRIIDSLKGKDLEQVLAAGREKLSAMPAGGGAVAAAAPAAGGGSAAAPAAAVEKKEEKKKEESESEDEDMGFGLFD